MTENYGTLNKRLNYINMQHFTVALGQNRHPTRDFPVTRRVPSTLPDAKTTKLSPFQVGGENASIYFVGTATTIMLVYDADS